MNRQNQLKKPRRMPAQALFNRVVIWLLQSPFHGLLSTHLMLLTYTGKHSGKKRHVPVAYLQQEKIVTSFTEKEATWWKNFRGGIPVTVRLRGWDYTGIAVPVINDREAITPMFRAFLQRNRQAGGFHAVPFDSNGQPDEEALEQSIQTKVMIRISLEDCS